MEIFEGPGFRMERQGRFIESVTHRTAEAQEQLTATIAAAAPSTRADLAAAVENIQKRLEKYDTFTVLGELALVNHLLDPETYQENTHKGESVVVEYAALLALKRDYCNGSELYVDSAVLEQLQTDLKAAFHATVWLQLSVDAEKALRQGRASEPPQELEMLQFMMRTHELGVRNPAYQHHHHEVLRGLFRPFEQNVISAVGFSVDDALRLAEAINRRMHRRFYDRLLEAASEVEKMDVAVQRARKSISKGRPSERGHGVEEEQDVVTRLARLSTKSAKMRLKALAAEWTLFAADDICSFTAEELAEEADLDVSRTSAYLNAFCINFGEVPAEFTEFSATHPLRMRPIIHHNGRYLSPALMLLNWAIQPKFEAVLKNSMGSTWERYQKHRHDWLLNKSIDLLERMMPSAEFTSNLFYDQDGSRAKEAELDALGRYDGIAFLLEAKGMDVTEPARRGAPDRLRRDLNAVIRDSHSQAIRAKAHLRAGGESHFRRADGPDVTIGSSEIDEIILLSVSLAPLGHLTALLHANSELGFFKTGEYSWVVSLYDLMVIAEIIDLPPVFPHYVRRRIHAAHMGVLQAHDELDIFGHYLMDGLYLDDIAAEMRAESNGEKISINLLSYTNPIDAYIFHSIGARKTPAPKPAQRMPGKFRSLLERLEKSVLRGRLPVALAMLDLDEQSRKDFVRYIERARQISHRNRRMSNGTLVGGDANARWGLTYICGSDAHELRRALPEYCERKQREMGTRTWLGLAECIKPVPEIVSVSVLRAP